MVQLPKGRGIEKKFNVKHFSVHKNVDIIESLNRRIHLIPRSLEPSVIKWSIEPVMMEMNVRCLHNSWGRDIDKKGRWLDCLPRSHWPLARLGKSCSFSQWEREPLSAWIWTPTSCSCGWSRVEWGHPTPWNWWEAEDYEAQFELLMNPPLEVAESCSCPPGFTKTKARQLPIKTY